MENLQGIDPENANEISLALERMSYSDIKSRIPVNRRYNINRALVYLNLPDVVVHRVPAYAYSVGDSSEDSLTNVKCDKLPCAGGKCPL